MTDQPNDNVRHLRLVKGQATEDDPSPVEEMIDIIRGEFSDEYLSYCSWNLLDRDVAHLTFHRVNERSTLTVDLQGLGTEDVERIDRIMGAAVRLGMAVEIK